jgi:poly-gamma-glutamate capsule biosynthesis protein CapA/YwtB (metallophosphatase superfamily)
MRRLLFLCLGLLSSLAASAGDEVARTVVVDMSRGASAVVRLLFVGDIMLDDGPGRAIAAGRDPFAEFADEFANADVRIGNLECPIASSGKAMASKIYAFRANPQVIEKLSGRFDAVSVANNHSGDYGHEAFLETLSLLDIAGVKAFGGGRNLTEAHAPYIVERNGLRIAILGYNEFKPRAFEAGPDWPGIAWSEDSHVVRDIQAARAKGADIVIPFMHWGWERERAPTARQRQLARLMIDAGADAVVGNHPHVTQGSEVYEGKPIIYSLGNFVFDGFDLPAAKEGWLLRMTVSNDGVQHWEVVPAYMDADGLPQRKKPESPAAAR